ncbi:MAG: DUF420 domain-containing protein [Pyrinomonadaceae bacterium]|nr:DUF420 domain-containing protein [Pyrinomonadaceae bacterium]
MDEISENKSPNLLINSISVIVPLLVILMLALPNKLDLGGWTKALPHVIGSINTLTTVALVFGLVFIKKGRITGHRIAMSTAFFLGIVFLFCYVGYHISNPANRFRGAGAAKIIYLAILASHIVMSLVVLPLVLRAMYFAVTKQFLRHKKIVKFAYPIWLYVSATGVIVYFMLYHLYAPN